MGWEGGKKSDAWGMVAFVRVYSMPSASHTLSHCPSGTSEGENLGMWPQVTQLGALGTAPSLFGRVPATKLYIVLGPGTHMNDQEKGRSGQSDHLWSLSESLSGKTLEGLLGDPQCPHLGLCGHERNLMGLTWDTVRLSKQAFSFQTMVP